MRCRNWDVSGVVHSTSDSNTYDVTGMSPQSMTLPQKLKGFVS
jgi:hypothetical protein